MAAYLVAHVEVTNPSAYQDYLQQVDSSIRAYGGRYLVRAGRTEVLEGGFQPRRFVVVEFADAARARAWWDSAEYAAAKQIRKANAQTDMFIAEGVDAQGSSGPGTTTGGSSLLRVSF